MKFSIIIPFYNVQAYTDELLDCLKPQLTKDVEVLVIDDGSDIPFKTKHKWVRVFHKENGGVSTARNMGINESTGDYISFIDADDLVAPDYVKQILAKIDEGFDYLEMSWNSLPGGQQWSQKLNSVNDSLPNPSACTRVFKRSCIGDLRFNEKKLSTEDEDFKRKLYFTLKGKKKAVITDYLYHYRTGVENSKSKRFMAGEMTTKRIIYHYNHVTKEMAYLIDEIAKEDVQNEVWMLTNQNDLPELEYYCRVRPPHAIRGMELRGEPYKGFTLIKQAYKTQVVLFIDSLKEINGITTWIYNFCLNMKDRKDIIVLYREMDSKQLNRLIKIVQCEKVSDRKIICDYLIMCSIQDEIPKNVRYKKSIQVIHSCKDSIALPEDRDMLINVSQVSKHSFGCDSIVIPNMMGVFEKSYLIVSTSRIGAVDKGDNDKRMVKLAKILNSQKIKFTWLYFSDTKLKNVPENMIRMDTTLDILNWIQRADMLINLTDQEGFCYSIVEAMCLGTKVITTDIDVLPEIGFKDGIHGFSIPFEFTDEDVLKAWNSPCKTSNYAYDNKAIIETWLDVLGHKTKRNTYNYEDTTRTVQAIEEYTDIDLNRDVFPGEQWETSADRALMLKNKGLVDIL